jgi:hypothetical protein
MSDSTDVVRAEEAAAVETCMQQAYNCGSVG